MNKFRRFLLKFKEKKGLTGADVAAAITVIVLAAGIATAIYVNSINKSKDNMRYSAAVRIATSVVENIEKQPYETLETNCSSANNYKYNFVGNGNKSVFETKIPNGFKLTVTTSVPTTPDIVRDVIVNVQYKANNNYKTITLTTLKEREMLDMTNSPDLAFLDGYNPNDNTQHYYPIKLNSAKTSYVITTFEDNSWYDYNAGNYAIIYVTASSLNVNDDYKKNSSTGQRYVWIPRFVSGTSGSGVQYLYGSSDYKIIWRTDNNFGRYSYIDVTSKQPKKYDEPNYRYVADTFSSNDGYAGFWYNMDNSANQGKITSATKELLSKNPINNVLAAEKTSKFPK